MKKCPEVNFIFFFQTIAFLLSSIGPVEAIYNSKLLKEIIFEEYNNVRSNDESFDIDQWGLYR